MLEDGIPNLHQNFTRSPPSIPSEKEHASCHREVADFPFAATVSMNVLNAPNSVWRRTMTQGGSKYLLYSSKGDIAYFVRRFLDDILVALALPLEFHTEVTIKQTRPDIFVLLLDMCLVGVVQVKKPGGNVLLQPTVLGELLDQMLFVEGLYCMGPVVGILTTAEEWIVSWFPADTRALAQGSADATSTSTSAESTHTQSQTHIQFPWRNSFATIRRTSRH